MAWLPLAMVCAEAASGQVITYEGDILPENAGWTWVPYCEPVRDLQQGWFQQAVEMCETTGGCQQDGLRRQLGKFVGADTFFLEWRAETTGPASEIPWTAPALMVIGGNFGTSYHFTFARDRVQLIRDNLLPILLYPLIAESPHTFRLELFNAEPAYVLYIDGEKIEEGVAEGAYPQNSSAVIAFWAWCKFEGNSTRWDFVRVGEIPQDASGDYDSDGQTTLFDWYFMHDCLMKDGELYSGPWEAGPGSGPGCRFVDSDGDSDTDLYDFAEFANLFGTSHP